MKNAFLTMTVIVAITAWQPGHVYAQSAALEFLTKPALIECETDGGEPCFRMSFGFVDENGRPVNAQLPPADQLASHVEVQIDGQAVKPFYALATAADSNAVRRPRTTMLLFDISGSMLTNDLGGQSRFEAAKGAAEEYLKNFSDGQDRIAIVPFASRDVERNIAAARFVSTRAEAQAELDALPQPEPRNNTALYSAVRTAVETLQQQRQPGQEQPHLILLTDGTNDVRPQAGDDPGQLAGASGLTTVATAVQQSGVDVLPIGLGNRRSIDEVAMTRLGTRPPLITFDLNKLHKAFESQQLPQYENLTVTLQAPQRLGSRTLLSGRVIHFRAKVTQADGSVLMENRQALWVAPPVATPSFGGEATDAEQRAFLANASLDHGSMMLFARPLLVFTALAVLLAVLWFGLPRLLWPERYDHRAARPVRPDYWPGAEPLTHRDSKPTFRQAPPGFETGRAGARTAVRNPSDHTIVRPVTGFDPNKTRLS